MKKLFPLLFILLVIACSDKPVSRIEGEVPDTQYDQEWVYLVPIEGATSETVDSIQIQKGRFQFQLSAQKQNQIFILRLKPILRLRLQDILVISEPGILHVKMDSVSYASGTPLNQVLQQWKDKKKEKDLQSDFLFTQYRSATNETEKENLTNQQAKINQEYADTIYQLVLKNKDNVAGKFIYSTHKSLFTSEQNQAIELIK